jgi:uncharacterized protein (TIGR03437 family)
MYMVGTGVVADVYPILNSSFVGGVEGVDYRLGVRAVDRYGIPVTGAPVTFAVDAGGGKITLADRNTVNLGVSFARVDLGTAVGDQTFSATVGGLKVLFDGYARNWPDFVAEGVKNAASFETGRGFAPGSYISIFGTDLADATQVTSTLSLPVSLSDVSVTFDADDISQPGRLHFVSPGQVNVQIPWELQGKSSVKVKVWIGLLFSYVITVPLATYSPGVFEVGGGFAAVQDANFALITQDRPARRGDAIQIYVNGLGPVSNRPGSGEPSPGAAGTLAQTNATPSVSIGGVPAQVVFSGMTPGVVGLYQINAVVPQNAPTGNQQLGVSIGGVTAKTTTLPVQ